MTKKLTPEQTIAELKVAQGDVFNVMDAVLRDAVYSMKQDIENQWPVDTGESIAGFETKRTVDATSIVWSIINDVEYVPTVWASRGRGGPPGLVYRVIATFNETEVLERISNRILDLLE